MDEVNPNRPKWTECRSVISIPKIVFRYKLKFLLPKLSSINSKKINKSNLRERERERDTTCILGTKKYNTKTYEPKVEVINHNDSSV